MPCRITFARNTVPVVNSRILTMLATDRADMDWQKSAETLVNPARVRYAPRVIGGSVIVLGSLTTPIQIRPKNSDGTPGVTTFQMAFKDAGGDLVGGDNVIPPVATTDYRIFANMDGTGTEYTTNSFIAFSFFIEASQISITISSGLSFAVWLTFFQARGNEIDRKDEVVISEGDTVLAQKTQSEPYTHDLPFAPENDALPRSLAHYLFTILGVPFPEATWMAWEQIRVSDDGTDLLLVDIGDVGKPRDAFTGVNLEPHIVIGMSYDFGPLDAQSVRRIEFELERLDGNSYLVLGHATKGKLDGSNRLWI